MARLFRKILMAVVMVNVFTVLSCRSSYELIDVPVIEYDGFTVQKPARGLRIDQGIYFLKEHEPLHYR